MDVTHTLDCGRSTASIYDEATQTSRVITHEELLRLPEQLPPGSFIVSEAAHLGVPQTDSSMAQPFDQDQLLSLYDRFEEHGITFRLFPQKSMPRAIGYTNERIKDGTVVPPASIPLNAKGLIDKGDLVDPWAMRVFLMNHRAVIEALMKPKYEFHTVDNPDPFRKNIEEFKGKTTQMCNFARTRQPAYSDSITGWIKDNAEYIHDNLSEEARDCFGFKYYVSTQERYNNKIQTSQLSKPPLFSIAAVLMNFDLSDRIRPETGNLPGWKYVKRHIFCMTPFHLKGGTARSNIYHHGMKAWISAKVDKDLNIKGTKQCARGGMVNKDPDKPDKQAFSKAQEQLFLHYRQIYCRAIKEVFLLFRKMRMEGM